jgi:Phospholipase A2
VTKPKREAKDPKRNGGAPTISAPYLGEISLPVLSEVAKSGSPDKRGTPRQLSLPVYGNYCGLGHGDRTGNTPPVDAVDAACREHDLCYALLGDFDGRCDQDFVESMPSAIASTPSPAGKHAGLLALLYFSLAERNLALGKTLFKRT